MIIKMCTVKFNSKFSSRRGLTSSACLRKVLFSTFAHSMHSRQSSTSWPVAASMSRKRSSKERTSRAALALEMEFRKGRTYFNRPPSSARIGNGKRTFENKPKMGQINEREGRLDPFTNLTATTPSFKIHLIWWDWKMRINPVLVFLLSHLSLTVKEFGRWLWFSWGPLTCSLSRFGQQSTQLQDALLFNAHCLLIAVLDVPLN